MAHANPPRTTRKRRKLRSRAARRQRSASALFFSVFLGLFALIGLAFLGSGLQLTGRAVRTAATVTAVRHVTDLGLARARHTEFTLRFTAGGRVITERIGQVLQVPAPPTVGDRIQVYYMPGDPADVTDVRYGRPGTYDFGMGALFGGIAVVGWAGLATARWRAYRPGRRSGGTTR